MSLNRRHRRNLADATYETGINTSSEDLYHSDDHYQNTDSDYDVSDRTYANYSELVIFVICNDCSPLSFILF